MKPASFLAALAVVAPCAALAQIAPGSTRGSVEEAGPVSDAPPLETTLRPTAPGTPPNALSNGRPGYGVLRQDEDWSVLFEPSRRTDPLDAFKNAPLSADGSIRLSLAADAYVSGRSFTNENFGLSPGTDPTLNSRLNLHASLEFGERLRLYGAVKHGDQYGRDGPVAPPNRDRLDLHQAFVEVSVGEIVGGASSDVFVRVGRQELHYGGGRLISARLGPNVRSDYDGVLARARSGPLTVDAFGFRGVDDRADVFDNGRDRAEDLWGVYASVAAQPMNVDLIYIGQKRDRSGYANLPAPGSEDRHTLGVRFATAEPLSGWSIDLEGAYQFGNFTAASSRTTDIEAWTVAGVVSKTYSQAVLEPVLGVEFGLTSGDADPTDEELGTFRAPAAPGRYFGEANPFGPGNVAGLRPYVEVTPVEGLTLRSKISFLWRLEEADGLYTLAPSVLRRVTPGERFIGSEPGLEATYRLGTHWTLSAFASRFITGGYFDSSPPGRDVTYLELTLAFRL